MNKVDTYFIWKKSEGREDKVGGPKIPFPLVWGNWWEGMGQKYPAIPHVCCECARRGTAARQKISSSRQKSLPLLQQLLIKLRKSSNFSLVQLCAPRRRLQVAARHQNLGGVAGVASVSCPATPSSDRARGHTVGRRRQAVSVSRGAEQTRWWLWGNRVLWVAALVWFFLMLRFISSPLSAYFLRLELDHLSFC